MKNNVFDMKKADVPKSKLLPNPDHIEWAPSGFDSAGPGEFLLWVQSHLQMCFQSSIITEEHKHNVCHPRPLQHEIPD